MIRFRDVNSIKEHDMHIELKSSKFKFSDEK